LSDPSDPCSIAKTMKGWLRKALGAAQPELSRQRRRATEMPGQVATRGATAAVTLIVYGWEQVEPGTLAWVFPSFAAALIAVRAMKNAVRWAIVAGRREVHDVDVEQARAHGLVLAEAV
jgi:hypothetical protein